MFGVWKKRFPCLKVLRLKADRCLTVITAVAVLYNMAIRFRDEMQEGAEPRDAELADAFVGGPALPVPGTLRGNAVRHRVNQEYF